MIAGALGWAANVARISQGSVPIAPQRFSCDDFGHQRASPKRSRHTNGLTDLIKVSLRAQCRNASKTKLSRYSRAGYCYNLRVL